MVVVELQDLDDLAVGIRVLLGKESDEALSSAEKGLLVALRGDNLSSCQRVNITRHKSLEYTPASAYQHAC